MSGRLTRAPGSRGAWIIGLFLAGGVALLLSAAEPIPAPMRPGREAPAFALPRLPGGSSLSLEAQRGKVVLLNFWATWCKPCEDEMPAMERLYRTLAPEGLELMAISVDAEREDVESFRDRLGLSFPILWDPERRVSNAYQSYKFPETYLIDRAGVVVARFIGPKDWDAPAYVARIRRLLAGGRAEVVGS